MITLNPKYEKGELIAKLKFWFGQEYKQIFDNDNFIFEYTNDFVYVYLPKEVKK